jgi:class 3 adenylate cyclase
MRCPRCQHENPTDAVFCQECGTRLEAACPSCGTTNQLGAKFCKQCGQRLGQGEAAQAAPGPRFGAPESYTPKHLTEKILTSKAALEGERKQVTVLFADLKGSMELLADRDPEEARRLLDPVLERMMDAVHRYEGTVNQVMGDGIMALFGAPVAHEDHAVRACYAALDLQTAIRRYAQGVRGRHGIALQVRVGLNSGEVVVRAIGGDLRMDYSAVGQTTHLAARLEQLASPGTTLVTAETLRLAEGHVEVAPRGAVPVKGLDAPVETYELVGAGPRRSRLAASGARGLTRLVGRDAELEQLRQALGRAATGHGQVVALVGEAGVGKSRLGGGTLPPYPRLAHRAGKLGLLRHSHALPAAGRAPQSLLPGAASRRSPEDPGEADRESADARSGPPAHPHGAPRASGRTGGGSGVAGARAPAAP